MHRFTLTGMNKTESKAQRKVPSLAHSLDTAISRRRYVVMICDNFNCRGGLDGCNGSECRNPRWRKWTAAQYEAWFGEPPPKEKACSWPDGANELNPVRSMNRFKRPIKIY